MCEYAKVDVIGGKLPLCEPLNKPCTLCFLGNWNNYYECKRKEKEDGRWQLKNG